MKRFFHKIKNKIVYPNLKIGYGSTLRGKNDLSKNVIIGRECSINHSILKEGSILGHNVYLRASIIGMFSRIYNNAILVNVTLDKYSYIGKFAQLGNVKIGSFCSIGPNFICNSGNHPLNFVSTSPVFYSIQKQCGFSFARKQHYSENLTTIIGSDVWIGTNVILKSGVKINNGAVIAAGSVVTNDVPPYAIVGGIPAKIIKYRFTQEEIGKLLDSCWWEWSEERLFETRDLFVEDSLLSFFNYIEASSIKIN